MILISGTSNPKLAQKISAQLACPLAQVDIDKFPNGEDRIWVKTELKDQTVAIIQSFSTPVDEHIIEFTLLVDAAKNLGAKRIIAVIPWLGYSPQDQEFRKGEPVSVAVIAKIIQAVGVTHLLTVDIHSSKSLKHFSIPYREISALPIFIDYWRSRLTSDHLVIALDKGTLATAQKLSSTLNLPLAKFAKTRDRSTGEVRLEFVSGEVSGKHGLAIDDFVSTGTTRIQAAAILKSMGLVSYHDCITHPILAQDASAKLQASLIDSLVVTDTYPVPAAKRFPKLKILSIAPLIVAALKDLRL